MFRNNKTNSRHLASPENYYRIISNDDNNGINIYSELILKEMNNVSSLVLNNTNNSKEKKKLKEKKVKETWAKKEKPIEKTNPTEETKTKVKKLSKEDKIKVKKVKTTKTKEPTTDPEEIVKNVNKESVILERESIVIENPFLADTIINDNKLIQPVITEDDQIEIKKKTPNTNNQTNISSEAILTMFHSKKIFKDSTKIIRRRNIFTKSSFIKSKPKNGPDPLTTSIQAKEKELKEFKYCVITDLKIGEGEFSETFKCYRYDKGKVPIKAAAKRLKNFKDDQTKHNFFSEISVLSQLERHEYVIEYLGVHRMKDSIYMVFEFADKSDLKRLLDGFRKNFRRDINLNNSFKLKMAFEIASGMEYISSLDIVHKDLAARNILLDKNYTCKIADFGCCKADFLNKRPIRWMAPECFKKNLFTTSSDIW
jgi:hypothetical protein